MKLGQPVDISTTEMLLALGSQAIFQKDRKKLVPKKKTKHGEGIITNGCINSWVSDSLIKYIFKKLFDKQVKADGLLIFQRGIKKSTEIHRSLFLGVFKKFTASSFMIRCDKILEQEQPIGPNSIPHASRVRGGAAWFILRAVQPTQHKVDQFELGWDFLMVAHRAHLKE